MEDQIRQVKALGIYEARNKEDTFVLTWIDLGDKFAVIVHDQCHHPNCNCGVKVQLGDTQYDCGNMEDYDTWIRPFAQIFLMPSVERQLKNKRVTPGMTWLTRAKSPEFRFNWEFTVMKKSKKEMMLVLQSKFNPAYVQQHTKPSSVPQPEPSIAVP